MIIEKAYEVCCDECAKGFEELNFIGLFEEDVYLCDKCLQELNRKIVEHLAEKNI